MNSAEKDSSQISSIIIEHIAEQKTHFVFSTQLAADTWADWIVSHSGKSKTKAVALDRFLAWDTFKSQYLNTSEKDATSIPALLRKIFARELIAQNAKPESEGGHFFKSLIRSSYADDALSFTDWISSMLPSLKLWHDRYEEFCSSKSKDEEDTDYDTLYKKYKEFLEDTSRNGKQKLFDPAWITPELDAGEHTFIIFYPEIFEDYAVYESFFDNTPSVTSIHLPKNTNESIPVSFYSNARTELRALSLKIRKLHEINNVDYRTISISVPDIDTYRPYIERELTRYCIPYVVRSGESYTQNSAGRIFREIQDCYSSRFSYDSVRALLLDNCVPWKNPAGNERLVRDGCVCKCICNFEDGNENDVWTKSLNRSGTSEGEIHDYYDLRSHVTALCSAKTFSAIEESWSKFKTRFLSNEFSAEADAILGRCITELSELSDIDKTYVQERGMTVSDPYSFFLNEIEQKKYQPQIKKTGVTIYDYRTTACAAFEYQFVLNASQSSLAAPRIILPFLNHTKRAELKLEDRDFASPSYVRIYAHNGTTQFSGSEKSFSGYAIPFSALKPKDKDQIATDLESLSQFDFISSEISSLQSSSSSQTKVVLSEQQKLEFQKWQQLNQKDESAYAVSQPVAECSDYLLKEHRASDKEPANKIHVTQSDMKDFFPCPRQWLFHSLFKIMETTLDTDLLQPYETGDIYHKILELFMKNRKDSQKPLPVANEKGTFENDSEIISILSDCADKAFNSKMLDSEGSALVSAVLASQKNNFVEKILGFLHILCAPYGKEGGFGGCSVINVEDWFNEPHEKQEEQKFLYTGKLDCVLEAPNKDITILDYKSGETPKVSQCKISEKTPDAQLADFQIALYVKLWNLNNDDKRPITNALFYSINKGEPTYVVWGNKPDKKRSLAVSIDDYEQSVVSMEQSADSFARDCEVKQFAPVKEKVRPYVECISCKYRAVCRTTYTAAGEKL